MELITGNVMDHTVRVMDASLTAPVCVWSAPVEGTRPPRTACLSVDDGTIFCRQVMCIRTENTE